MDLPHPTRCSADKIFALNRNAGYSRPKQMLPLILSRNGNKRIFIVATFPNAIFFSNFSLWIKPTDASNSNFIGITTLQVSGSLSAHHQEFLAVHQLWHILCSCDDRSLPGVRWNCKQFHPTPGSKRSSQLHKMCQSWCTAKNSWWWAERLPETCRVVIPIKLEFGASVGFIHKECVTMHLHNDREIYSNFVCFKSKRQSSGVPCLFDTHDKRWQNLRKSIFIFVRSVRPSVLNAWNNSTSNRSIFKI